jgi:hypothetical protein
VSIKLKVISPRRRARPFAPTHRAHYVAAMDISLSDPMTWVVVIFVPVIIVALRWSLRGRRSRRDRDS